MIDLTSLQCFSSQPSQNEMGMTMPHFAFLVATSGRLFFVAFRHELTSKLSSNRYRLVAH